MKGIVFVAAALMLANWGALAQELSIPPIVIQAPGATSQNHTRAPIDDRAECACQYQCEAMWAAAPEALESSTGMRVRMAADTFVETYAPYRGQFGVLSGRATKRPDGQGGYRIVGDFQSRYGDASDVYRAKRLFYLTLNEAAIGIQCPAKQAANN